ncbi:hypothetical protein CCAN12_800119 [Capnocytophaga canimorsus]|uniref:Uncharacterized protein n=1 Tax=Capnocytophaga canimorsus TaxID=28188 RepID=A0A0B7HTM3_9FLAO|nr:hypothetical protein CCAN12_800119 [Capnocytophaga canimorsus]
MVSIEKWQYVAYISPILFFLNLLLVYVFEIRIVPVYFFFTLNLVIAYAHLKPLLKESLKYGTHLSKRCNSTNDCLRR